MRLFHPHMTCPPCPVLYRLWWWIESKALKTRLLVICTVHQFKTLLYYNWFLLFFHGTWQLCVSRRIGIGLVLQLCPRKRRKGGSAKVQARQRKENSCPARLWPRGSSSVQWVGWPRVIALSAHGRKMPRWRLKLKCTVGTLSLGCAAENEPGTSGDIDK